MNDSYIIQALETKFNTDFAARQPTVPIQFNNAPFKQPTSGNWVYFAVIPNKDMRANIGAPSHFKGMGVINIQVMGRENTGSRAVYAIVDDIFDILSDIQVALAPTGSVTTYGAEKRDRGVINGWFTVNVQFDYRSYGFKD